MSTFDTLFKQGKDIETFISTGTPEQIADLRRWQTLLESQTEAVENALSRRGRLKGAFACWWRRKCGAPTVIAIFRRWRCSVSGCPTWKWR